METYHTELPMSSSNISTDTSKYHLIKNKWILWAHLPQDPDWTVKSYKKIYTFKNVEETVGITESLPADFIKNCMLFIMKEGVAPMWEDPKNRNGGCFSYKVSNKTVVDVWRELTYGLIGDTISTNSTFVNSVTGITISPKKNFCIVKIWLTNCEHQNPQIVTSDIKHLIPQGCLFKKHTPEY
jgi:hypothetical protein